VRILITGVSGQVGSALLQSLDGRGTLVPADRTALDLTRPAEITTRLDALRPEVIVNPAAYTAVDRAEDERDLAFTVNGESPGVIARWAANRRVPLIHFSTDYVFDGSGTRPWREDDPTAPLSVYGASKLAGEQAVAAAGGAHLIVRTCWVYAARGTNFMRTIARLAREREELRIVADQFGAPTPAAWIAEATARIIARDGADLAGGFARAGHRLHLAAGGETSWHGFASAIVAGLEQRGTAVKTQVLVPIGTKEYPVKAARPLNSRLDVSRLEQSYGIVSPAWNTLLERELDRLAAEQA
jgi:dTDP-4-dehydrorhamnose reductase